MMTERRLVAYVLVTVIFVIMFAMNMIRTASIFKLQAQYDVLQRAYDSGRREWDEDRMNYKNEIDQLRINFDQRITKIEGGLQRTPIGIPQWQVNRNKDIDKRLTALEAWRYRMEK